MFSTKFTRLKNPASWRRLSIATWKAPNDSSVYGSISVEATPLLHFLDQINKESPVKITLTHLIAKAVATILQKYPDINGIIRWGQIYLRKSVDIFFQVALLESSELDKPDLSGAKIENCESKTICQIAKELVEKSQKIRGGKDPQFKQSHQLLRWAPTWLLPIILRFISFLVHDLGVNLPKWGLPADPFGSVMITSVGSLKVPPGFAPLVPVSRVPLILCVGGVEKKPWVVEGGVAARPVLDINVTFDHRFMDGVTGARMFHFFKEILATPEKYLT